MAKKIRKAPGYVGLLNHNEFNFTVLSPSNSSKNPLPLEIKLGGYCFGRNLNIILTQTNGINSLIKSQIWQADRNINNLTQPPSFQTVTIKII